MSTKDLDQAFIRSLLGEIIEGTVQNAVSNFLIDRKSQRLSANTIRIYSKELEYLLDFLNRQGVITLDEFTPEVLRFYLLALSER